MDAQRDMSGALVGGRYRVLNRVAAGGMGTIYTGEHVELGLRVAIKVLHGDANQDPTRAERFRREARAAAQIEHENVCGCIDIGVTEEGQLFQVMEWLRGEDLHTLLRREGSLPWPRARAIVLQLCRALAAAHARGIIHRDLKPSNLMLIRRGDSTDFLKVVDFGIAKRVVGETAHGALTSAGEVIGTLAYMAPEQAAAETIDHRVDVYAAGVILYQALSGRVPFRGKKVRELVTALLTKTPPPLREADPRLVTSDAFEALFQQILHRDPEQRVPDMTALHHALAQLPEDACVRGEAVADASASATLTQVSSTRGETAASTSGLGGAPTAIAEQTLNTTSSGPPARREGRRGLFVGVGGALAALVGVAVFSGSSPEPAASAVAAAPAAVPELVREPSPALEVESEAIAVEAEPAEAKHRPAGDEKVSAKAVTSFAAVMKKARARVGRCLGEHGVKAGTGVRFEVTVAAQTGRIAAASPQGPFAGQTALGACVVDATKGAAVRPGPANEWRRSHEFGR